MLSAGALAVPMLIGGGRYTLLTAEIYAQVVTFIDLPLASALALGLLASLVPPLVLIERGTVWRLRQLAGGLFRLAVSQRDVLSSSAGYRSRAHHARRTLPRRAVGRTRAALPS